MAKSLTFQYGKIEAAAQLNKVDRSVLYGYKSIETLDEHGDPCAMATLADDGKTVVGKGGTGIGYLTADGNWCSKTELIPVDLEGNRIEPVPSSYAAPIQLDRTATVDEYLAHSIRSVYQIDFLDPADSILDELNRGTIFRFDYSFRGGLEYDAGFLIRSAEGQNFMVIGVEAPVSFLSLSQSSPTVSEDDGNEDVDALDFEMNF